MKFLIKNSDFLSALNKAAKAVPSKTSLPILSNFLIETKEFENENEDGEKTLAYGLSVTGSDGEITIMASAPLVEVEEGGKAAIPAGFIVELLKNLPDEIILCTFDTEKKTARYKWSNGKADSYCEETSDYPNVKELSDPKKMKCEKKALAEAIDHTIDSVSNDEMRPVMNGIFFNCKEDGAEIVATDSQRLVVHKLDSSYKKPGSFILPKKTASIIKNICTGEGAIKIRYDDHKVKFITESVVVISRTINGRYPNYNKVIPENNDKIMTVGKEDFEQALKRVATCADKASGIIKLELDKTKTRISSQDLMLKLKAQENYEADYEGEALSIGFKASLLTGILSKISGGKIFITFKESKTAAIITSEDNASFKAMLMPTMVA